MIYFFVILPTSRFHKSLTNLLYVVIMFNQEHLANKKLIQAAEAEEQQLEEERQKLFVKTKSKMMKLRKEKEAEMFRYSKFVCFRKFVFHT